MFLGTHITPAKKQSVTDGQTHKQKDDGQSDPCVVLCFQARSQGTFDVEAFSGRGFGAALRPPMGPGQSPGGARGRSPPKVMDFTHLRSRFSTLKMTSCSICGPESPRGHM